jgi:phosphatidate cytidylyltransferase
MNWNVFFKRLMSAVVFCAIIIAGMTTTFEVMLSVAMIIQFLCIKECWYIFSKIDKDASYPKVIYWLVQLAAIFISASIALVSNFGDNIYAVLLIPIILMMVGALQKTTALKAALSGLMSLLYVAIPIASMVAMYMAYRGGTLYANVPLALILLIWTNDTMAYITGSFIGKTPFSAISPKKTWEGTIGGVVFTVVSVVLLNYLNWMPHIKLQDWIVLALIASIIGTAGDLLESKLKRIADVKDSGNIMPGHGGALDRFDSMLVSLPFAYCYAMLFMVSSQA